MYISDKEYNFGIIPSSVISQHHAYRLTLRRCYYRLSPQKQNRVQLPSTSVSHLGLVTLQNIRESERGQRRAF